MKARWYKENLPKLPGVYGIFNTVNGKVYVGSDVASIPRRWWEHKGDLRSGVHPNKYLQHAWNKYGERNFQFVILCKCKPDECVYSEQFCLDAFRAANRDFGYNLSPTAHNLLGYKHTNEAKRKIGDGNRGKVRTQEMKDHQSRMKKGIPLSEEHAESIRIAVIKRIERINASLVPIIPLPTEYVEL